ncbi:thermostable monoacylglycerol lipase [mine drainage metagenome]|jgi:carboxylesterase|uniref:Thermostable monoacylglycerol lipase n=1 Tax=mine drainage metagenome TaxID=410659 RepID=A0A1J5QPN5_9ZZZZ
MTPSIQDCLGNTGYYDGDGEDAVLLIHGLTGTPAEMKPIAKRLVQQGFSVMCPALAGHCGSVGDLRKSRWQDWYGGVAEAFEALKARHANVYVAGLSMGALIALLLAREKGARVAGIGLLSTTFFYDGWNMPRLKRKLFLPIVLHSPLRYFMHWDELPPYGIKCERTRAMVHAVLQNRDALATESVGIFRTSGVTIYESTRLIKAAKRALPHVHVPTLIVHSTEDDTASLKNAHFVAKKIASGNIETFFVDDTYHVLTLDKRRNDVAHRMAVFFKKCTAHQAVPA